MTSRRRRSNSVADHQLEHRVERRRSPQLVVLWPPGESERATENEASKRTLQSGTEHVADHVDSLAVREFSRCNAGCTRAVPQHALTGGSQVSDPVGVTRPMRRYQPPPPGLLEHIDRCSSRQTARAARNSEQHHRTEPHATTNQLTNEATAAAQHMGVVTAVMPARRGHRTAGSPTLGRS